MLSLLPKYHIADYNHLFVQQLRPKKKICTLKLYATLKEIIVNKNTKRDELHKTNLQDFNF